ncbi:Concanavalin A-like lectin/glucanases superfamily protein [Halogranum amylolyticum]|uniref:Concanavalin A-like lectin/glucanases superfamily protein n=1 Tax=Halogranum amylolyticum TaxID=660520 RepID=A0A1H8W4X7_9EURY|nr:LamG-like jellyroll fold domain-containing protein [Halogranum amylolyticum]SEP22497.1 Concanavalin A-like lectin/glucanases superfamily protein [Halogranum amylolyticum]
MEQKRRTFLWSLSAAAAGLAGCIGQSTEPAQTPTETGSPSHTPTDTETTTPESQFVHSGDTIPPWPTETPGTLPLVAGPSVEADNPVLTAADVTDYGDVDYVADPFMFVEEGEWHMFFEIVNHDRRPDAPIGHATSDDGLEWEYDQVVLQKDEHTSFPLIWKYDGEYYMCPPTGKRVELWKAEEFPTEWSKVGNAIDVDYYSHDPVFFRYDGRWWLATDKDNDKVMLYHSTELEATDWTPHENNPVVTGRREAARQGGRPLVVDDEIYFFFQDLEDQYGDKTRAYRVTDLTTSSYADEEVASSPVLSEFGVGWNATTMHTFDPWSLGDGKGWRCAVDGTASTEDYSIGIYDVPTVDPTHAPKNLVDEYGATAWYDFSHGLDGVVFDRCGSHHGTIRGTSATRDTTLGAGRVFAGTDEDRVLVPHEFPELLKSRSFTLLLSVAPGDGEDARVLDYGKRSKTRGMRVDVRDGEWAVTVDSGGTESTVRGGDATTPTTLAIVRDGGYTVYADGEMLESIDSVGTFHFNNSYTVFGGAMTGGENFTGSVHGYWLLDDVLTADELGAFAETVHE